MARARNIKPGFFANENLAECDPLARLLFAGLWCLADRAGRLEDRPKRIRAELLPYDMCDADALLEQLQKHGFITRYEVDGTRFIQVLNFDKHQNPHMKEAKSTIPAPSGFEATSGEEQGQSGDVSNEHQTSTVQVPDKHQTSPADSGFLIPDSLIPENTPQPPKGGRRGSSVFVSEGFARFWAAWPNHKRKGAKSKCLQLWCRKSLEGKADSIVSHVELCKASQDWRKQNGEFIPAPLVYLNGERWDGAGDNAGSSSAEGDYWHVAGFPNIWEAQNAECWPHTAHRFRDGKRLPEEVAA